ncbi:hypothetical protein QJQ45_010235 [Haematococcus lacustris]|nr:hypothetical protein QJQ45_010235 [Haematococcus lacustris]
MNWWPEAFPCRAAYAAVGLATRDYFPELRVVLPISFFERANQAYFNSVAVLDTDGTNLGVYRKSHIPDGPGYQEKFYFSPGDTGFRVFDTRVGRLGVAVCWDQWFPEAARAMVLQGAEVRPGLVRGRGTGPESQAGAQAGVVQA